MKKVSCNQYRQRNWGRLIFFHWISKWKAIFQHVWQWTKLIFGQLCVCGFCLHFSQRTMMNFTEKPKRFMCSKSISVKEDWFPQFEYRCLWKKKILRQNQLPTGSVTVKNRHSRMSTVIDFLGISSSRFK